VRVSEHREAAVARALKVAIIGAGMSGICMAAKLQVPQTIWVSGCSSWYLGKDGLPELFPWTPKTHHELLRQPEPADFDVRTA
jgi:hypothetical protein